MEKFVYSAKKFGGIGILQIGTELLDELFPGGSGALSAVIPF